MKSNTWKKHTLSVLVAALALCAVPAAASADVLGIWMAAKGNTFGGSGDVFQNFDKPFGGGAELGFELLFFSLYGEAIIMSPDQYLFTANLGFNFSIGDDVRLTLGAYTGPLFFLFPEQEVEGVDLGALSEQQVMALGYDNRAALEAEFDQYLQQEKDLSRLAVGWNLGRARMDIDAKLAPGVYLGLSGQAGYHLLISGEDVAAGAKNAALEKFAAENDVPDEAVDPLREALGAKPVDPKGLNGINYEANIHLRFELGI
jgi:hypothetical protein